MADLAPTTRTQTLHREAPVLQLRGQESRSAGNYHEQYQPGFAAINGQRATEHAQNLHSLRTEAVSSRAYYPTSHHEQANLPSVHVKGLAAAATSVGQGHIRAEEGASGGYALRKDDLHLNTLHANGSQALQHSTHTQQNPNGPRSPVREVHAATQPRRHDVEILQHPHAIGYAANGGSHQSGSHISQIHAAHPLHPNVNAQASTHNTNYRQDLTMKEHEASNKENVSLYQANQHVSGAVHLSAKDPTQSTLHAVNHTFPASTGKVLHASTQADTHFPAHPEQHVQSKPILDQQTPANGHLLSKASQQPSKLDAPSTPTSHVPQHVANMHQQTPANTHLHDLAKQKILLNQSHQQALHQQAALLHQQNNLAATQAQINHDKVLLYNKTHPHLFPAEQIGYNQNVPTYAGGNTSQGHGHTGQVPSSKQAGETVQHPSSARQAPGGLPASSTPTPVAASHSQASSDAKRKGVTPQRFISGKPISHEQQQAVKADYLPDLERISLKELQAMDDEEKKQEYMNHAKTKCPLYSTWHFLVKMAK